MRTFETSELETTRSDGSALVTQLRFQFRSGTHRNAGIAANVSLRMGAHRFHRPDMPGDEAEQDGSDTWAFAVHALRMTLAQLRAAEICLSQDSAGRKPGWYIDAVLIQVGNNRPNANPDMIRWLTYRQWQRVGCLAEDEDEGEVRFQKRTSAAPVMCAHWRPKPGCEGCRRRWPYHPGRRCRCSGCEERLLPHSP